MSNPFLDTRRHMELFDADNFNEQIHVIGVGATGSWLVLQLAKLGISGDKIHAWDFDVVEEHNVPNQLFGLEHIGQSKVEALADIVKQQTNTEIIVHNEKFEKQRLSGIVILMVDTMLARKDIWLRAIKRKSAVKHLIEPRMGLDMSRLYNVTPTDQTHIERYEDTFYSDEEAEVSACGTSQTVITSALSIASACVRQLINYNDGTPLANEILTDYKYNNIFTEEW